MQQGVITGDNFAQILRPLSQRRQSGVLEITSGNDTFRFFFDKGKIVDVSVGDQNGPQELLVQLSHEQAIPQIAERQVKTYGEALEHFLSCCPEEGSAQVLFAEKNQARIHKNLFLFSPRIGALFNFAMQGIESEPDFQVSITVNQYLIDLESTEEERQKQQETPPQKSEPEPGEGVQAATQGAASAQDIVSFLEDAIDASFQVDPIEAADIAGQQEEQQDADATLTEMSPLFVEDKKQGEDPLEHDDYKHLSSFQRMNNTLLHSERVPLVVMAVLLVSFVFFALIEWQHVFQFFGRV